LTRLRLLPLALLVAVLLGLVAVAAHGGPLGGGGRSHAGPSGSFLNYFNTTVVILILASLVFTIWALATNKSSRQPIARARRRPLAAILFLTICGLMGWLLVSKGFEKRFRQWEQRLHLIQRANQRDAGTPGGKHGKGQRGVELRWDEIAIVLALLGALGVAAFVASRRRPVQGTWAFGSQAAVSAALDESLDDLRSEPDLRKAIIAAYARMEYALAVAGLPRRPSEAPLEYMERALGELQASAGAVRRLTDLFEWAKFSHHEPEPAMRDEAIDALVAVRDELRAPAAEPVAA
jgi:hypothetical protein